MLEESILEEPVYRGLRGGSKVRGGIDVDIAKSALQKAIRRGDLDLACTMALRMNEFLNIEDGKAVRSNMLNRIPVIAGEDIGMANLDTILKLDEWLDRVRSVDSDLTLVRMIVLLCKSEKSRLGSHVNAVFYQAVSSPNYFERLDALRPSVLVTMKNIESLTFEKVMIEGEDGLLLSRVFYLLKNAVSDDEKLATFFYIRHLVNSENKYKISRGYPKKRMILSEPVYFIWNEMLTSCKRDRKLVLTILYKWFLNENERNIYLVLGLFVYFYFEEVEWKKIDVSSVIEEMGGLEKIKFRAMNEMVEIPEYVVDKHTKKGRSSGKTSVDFAVEGAVVENETSWMNKWKDLGVLYVDFRKFMPKFECKWSVRDIIDFWKCGGKKEIIGSAPRSVPRSSSKSSMEDPFDWDSIISGTLSKEHREKIMSEDTPRGQMLTSRYKKYVYIPKDETYVYKGPWNVKNGSEKERLKLRKLKFRFRVTQLMCAFVLGGDILRDDEDNLWMRYRSMASVDSDKWKIQHVKDDVSEKFIKVVDRASLGILPMSYYSHDSDKISNYLFGKTELYCDFLLLYVLMVGDTGLYNVLIGELAPMIIDIDDDTTKTEFSEVWSIFGRRPADNVVDVLKSGVKKNKEKIVCYLERLHSSIEEIVKIGQEYGLKIDDKDLKKRIENVKSVVLLNVKQN